jgi:predicted RNase H-like HicB family nuclease
MKTLKCDLCDATAQGETFEEWMKALMPHYMQAHADVMNGKSGLNDEEKQEEQQRWMVENKARFEAA